MTSQERYQAKKAAAHKREMILGLGDGVEIKFQYGGKTYRLRSSIFTYPDGKVDHSLSVWQDTLFGRGMNVDKVTDTALKLYNFDLMDTKTTYSMDINKMDFTIGYQYDENGHKIELAIDDIKQQPEF